MMVKVGFSSWKNKESEAFFNAFKGRSIFIQWRVWIVGEKGGKRMENKKYRQKEIHFYCIQGVSVWQEGDFYWVEVFLTSASKIGGYCFHPFLFVCYLAKNLRFLPSMFVCSIRLSVCLFVCLSVCLSVCVFALLHLQLWFDFAENSYTCTLG